MNSGMHAREESGTDAGVYLNQEHFDTITRVLGATTDAARARLLNVDPKTIYRVRHGIVDVGEQFIASALHVLRRNAATLEVVGIEPTFESMFEVRPKQVPA